MEGCPRQFAHGKCPAMSDTQHWDLSSDIREIIILVLNKQFLVLVGAGGMNHIKNPCDLPTSCWEHAMDLPTSHASSNGTLPDWSRGWDTYNILKP